MSTPSRGPLQPVYVLRGHNAQIHALRFYNNNLRLLTGDADGWIVLWDMVSRRPLVVWRAHEKSILTLRYWAPDKIITHGRDDALRVWHIPAAAEATLSKVLPTDGYQVERQSPWLLHSLLVNTMNFCAFALCQDLDTNVIASATRAEIMLAVPGTQDGYVHIHELPSEKCIHIVPPSFGITKSLVMAIRLYRTHNILFLVVGNEAGETSVQAYDTDTKSWITTYSSRPHSQPILSLDIAPAHARYFTSSADAIIASHPLSTSLVVSDKTTASKSGDDNMSKTQTGHAGQQSLCVRDDGRIFATAGWDARVRVYSAKSAMAEVAVLKWHKEGCYAVAFGSVTQTAQTAQTATAQLANATAPTGSVMGHEVDNIDVSDLEHTTALQRTGGTTLTVQQRREQHTRATHWLAAGAKDGKVSLWEVF